MPIFLGWGVWRGNLARHGNVMTLLLGGGFCGDSVGGVAGEFVLMKYRVSENINLPFSVLPVVKEMGRTRLEVCLPLETPPPPHSRSVSHTISTPLRDSRPVSHTFETPPRDSRSVSHTTLSRNHHSTGGVSPSLACQNTRREVSLPHHHLAAGLTTAIHCPLAILQTRHTPPVLCCSPRPAHASGCWLPSVLTTHMPRGLPCLPRGAKPRGLP